jgi:hypothetical protein
MEFRGISFHDKRNASMHKLRTKLAAQVTTTRAAIEAFEAMVQNPEINADELDQLQRQITRMVASQARLVTQLQLTEHESSAGKARQTGGARPVVEGIRGQRPMRELVLDVLTELDVPAQPRLVSEIAGIRFGFAPQVERFASLRRDEERAYLSNPTARPAWLVPAITSPGLHTYARIVTSSTWPVEKRIIGSLSLRANHLRTILSLVQMWERLAGGPTAPSAISLAAIITRFASTVPGALEHGTFTGAQQVLVATQHELDAIDSLDLQEREEAANQLRELAEPFQLWGRPETIEGGARRMGGHDVS